MEKREISSGGLLENMGEKMEMIKKQMDFNVQKEIIQWEEQCWILFQQKMRLFRQKV